MKKITKNRKRARCHPPYTVVAMGEIPDPHFFTIIASPTVQLRQLKIPDKFVEKHGDQLPERVSLQIRKEKQKWPVGLVKRNGKIWLLKGWSNFAEHYNLCIGQFLTFRYSCKDSGFLVSVFDASATDVKYRSSVSGRADPPAAEIRDDDGDDDSLGRKYIKKKYNGRDISTLMERANGFKSKNPHFAIYISATSVNGRSGLRLPREHSIRYFKNLGGKNNVVTLTSGNTALSKPRTVRYRIQKEPKRRNVWLGGAAWNKYARGNNIKMGDACVFELVNVEPLVYQVTVFRDIPDNS